jgi:hypothetical protein
MTSQSIYLFKHALTINHTKMTTNIMKNCIALPTLCALVFQFLGCKAQDPVNTDPNPVYEACCGAEPVEFTDAGYFYVPNMFTPNDDGKNDVFQPVFDYGLVEYISAYTIYQDTTIEPGLGYYNALPFDPKSNPKWWDGTLPDGSKHIGPFEYTIEFTMKDGSFVVVDGRACLVQCGPDAGEFTNRDGCYFGTQVTNGKFDKGVPNKEEDCFK